MLQRNKDYYIMLCYICEIYKIMNYETKTLMILLGSAKMKYCTIIDHSHFNDAQTMVT